MKFHEICFRTFKVIAMVVVCHNDNDNDYADDDDDDTRVMTIPQPFFFEKTAELKIVPTTLRFRDLTVTV